MFVVMIAVRCSCGMVEGGRCVDSLASWRTLPYL